MAFKTRVAAQDTGGPKQPRRGALHKRAGMFGVHLSSRRMRSSSATFLLPAAVFVLAFSAYPLAVLFRMSVSDVTAQTLTQKWPFIGIGNVSSLASQGLLWSATIHTLIYVGIVVCVGVGFGFAAAVVLRRETTFSAATMALMVFVWSLPPLVNGSIWKFLLSGQGLVNKILEAMGTGPVPWLEGAPLALISVALINGWATVPFAALILRASLLDIPGEILEAAAIDGASKPRLLWRIIIPSVISTLLVLVIIVLVNAFRAFDYTYVMTQGGPGTVSTTLPYLSYYQGFVKFEFGQGAAAASITVIVLAILAVIYGRWTRKQG